MCARCDMTCEIWCDGVTALRCDGGWYSQILANTHITSQHITSENFWHFCTSISHILNIMWLKYFGFNKNRQECWAQTVTDLQAPPSSGLDMTCCSQEFLLRVKRESAMSLISSSNKRMKRVREVARGTTWYWLKIRFVLNWICLWAGWRMASLCERLFWCLHIYGDRR